MEFYEFFESIVSFIPDGFAALRSTCEILLPWLFGLCTLATCFFGHFTHKIWNIFFFFTLGFFVPLFILFALFQPSGVVFWLLVLLCLFLGGLCGFHSHHLHRLKLFITTFLTSYIAVSGFLIALGTGSAILLGLIVAVFAGILAIKYKYMGVIITTAFSGSMMFWDMIEAKFSTPHLLANVLAILMGICGLFVQMHVEKKELTEDFAELKEQSQKIRNKFSKNKAQKN